MSDLAEKSVIGALFIDPECISKIYELINPNMFSNSLLGEIYKQIIKNYDIGQPFNLVTISQATESDAFPLEVIGGTIKECMGITVTSTDVVSYAKALVNEYKARSLSGILSHITITAATVNSQISDLLLNLEQLKGDEINKAESINKIVQMYQEQYFTERYAEKLYMGFPKLDDLTGGLEGGDVIVIGARPSVGKSAFVSQVILNMARAGKKIGFYNLEMSDKQIYERFLSSESGIQLNRIRRAVRFLGDEKERFEMANKSLSKFQILISSGTKTISQIRNECRHQELDCIVIDYLQLVKADVRYQSRASEVGAISKAIKALAMELNIPIIALSQLNRTSEMRDTKEPTMGELREAGDIEQDASIIILLWNLDSEDKTRKGLKVDKNRQGETGRIVYRFDGGKMRFCETDEIISDSDGFKRTTVSTPFD